MRLRQSTLGDADACLRRMQYSIERDVYSAGSVRAVGTGYHAGLATHYQYRMAGIEPATMDEIVNSACLAFDQEVEKADEFLWDKEFPDTQSAHEAIERMVNVYFEDEHQWPSTWRVRAIEQPFELPLDPHTISSHGIDLVLEDEVGYIVGVDHKTGGKMWPEAKSSPRKSNQAALYTWALRRLYPGATGYRFVFDIMTYAGNFARRISDPGPEHEAAVLVKARQLASLYEGMRGNGLDLPANPASNLCSPKWCDHWDFCPHGAVLDR